MSSESSQTNRRAVARLLSDRLERLDESQKWLAKRAGMSESSLSDILAMKQDITVQQANRLASVTELGLTATVILATAADAEMSDDQRLIKSMGLIGVLYEKLSPERREQVTDLITLLYRKESGTDAARKEADKGNDKGKPRRT